MAGSKDKQQIFRKMVLLQVCVVLTATAVGITAPDKYAWMIVGGALGIATLIALWARRHLATRYCAALLLPVGILALSNLVLYVVLLQTLAPPDDFGQELLDQTESPSDRLRPVELLRLRLGRELDSGE